MRLGLRNKVALVAASSKGLGRASAAALAAEGAKIAICARHEPTLRATADEIAAATGTEVLAVPTDLALPQDIEHLVRETVNQFGAIHILVTNAGGPPPGYFFEFDDEAWQDAFNLTLMSVVRLLRGVLPVMQEQQWGRIINITSLSVKEPLDHLILSNSIRASVHGLAKTLATQLGDQGITINNVMPGSFQTGRLEQLAEQTAAQTGQTPAEVLAELGQKAPVDRIGQPEELGALVAFLASEQAAYITGASIPIDGGRITAAF